MGIIESQFPTLLNEPRVQFISDFFLDLISSKLASMKIDTSSGFLVTTQSITALVDRLVNKARRRFLGHLTYLDVEEELTRMKTESVYNIDFELTDTYSLLKQKIEKVMEGEFGGSRNQMIQIFTETKIDQLSTALVSMRQHSQTESCVTPKNVRDLVNRLMTKYKRRNQLLTTVTRLSRGSDKVEVLNVRFYLKCQTWT